MTTCRGGGKRRRRASCHSSFVGDSPDRGERPFTHMGISSANMSILHPSACLGNRTLGYGPMPLKSLQCPRPPRACGRRVEQTSCPVIPMAKLRRWDSRCWLRSSNQTLDFDNGPESRMLLPAAFSRGCHSTKNPGFDHLGREL